jgi:hypothetical protein
MRRLALQSLFLPSVYTRTTVAAKRSMNGNDYREGEDRNPYWSHQR